MASENIFDSARECLRQGEKHIGDLQRQLERFWKTNPDKLVREVDPDTQDKLIIYRFVKPIPRELAHTAKDAITNLRDTLDQIGYACAVAAGKIAPKRTYFPIADSLDKLKTDVIGRGRCKDIPDEILALFVAFKPYKGGNDALWALNRLDNANQHRLVRPFVGAASSMVWAGGADFFSGNSGNRAVFFSSEWDWTKNQIVLVRVASDGECKLKGNLKIAALIVFSEIDILAPTAVDEVLLGIAREVERVLRGSKAEARRIGLIS